MSGSVTAGMRLLSSLLGFPAWTVLTPGNGWTQPGAGFANLQYAQWPLASAVAIIGIINAGTLTANTTIASLPVAPASQQDIPCVSIGAAVTNAPFLYVDTSGNLKVGSLVAGTTSIGIPLTFISLTA